ncbi:MAG: DUF3634 family protein [Polyangiaceae bacterium]
MTSVFPWIVLVLLAVPLVVALLRSNELFCIDVERGKPRFVRGRMPQRLLDEIADVVRKPKLDAVRIVAVVENGSPRLVVRRGTVSDAQLQQLRNVLGRFRLAEIRAGGRPR